MEEVAQSHPEFTIAWRHSGSTLGTVAPPLSCSVDPLCHDSPTHQPIFDSPCQFSLSP